MNRAEKAAETRKQNKLEKAISDKKLLESVQAPRKAFADALKNCIWTHTPTGGAKRAIDSEDDDSEIKSQPIKPPKKKGKVLAESTASSEPQYNIAASQSISKARDKVDRSKEARRSNTDSDSSVEEPIPRQEKTQRLKQSSQVAVKSTSKRSRGDLQIASEDGKGEGDGDAPRENSDPEEDINDDFNEDLDLGNKSIKELEEMLSNESATILDAPGPEALFNQDDNIILASDSSESYHHRSSSASFASSMPLTTSDSMDIHEDSESEALPSFDKEADIVPTSKSSGSCYHRSSNTSFSNSAPATDSDGVNMGIDYEDPESEVLSRSKLPKSKKPGNQKGGVKPLTQHEHKFRQEKPSVNMGTTTVANGQKQNAKQPNGTVKWPSHARIVPPTFGGTIRLTDQDPLVNHVIMGTIADLTKEWRRARLLASTNCSIEQFPQLAAFVSRLHADISFGYSLGALVINRFATLRAPAKEKAERVLGYYELGLGSKCKTRVAALESKKSFILPGMWDSNVWKIKPTEPFLCQALIETLKTAFFQHPVSVRFKLREHYTSSLAGSDRLELPIAMVALGGTGLYASLMMWKTGTFQKISIGGSVFAAMYQSLANMLERMKVDSPRGYHHIMSTLCEEMMGVASFNNDNNDDEAFNTIDLSGY